MKHDEFEYLTRTAHELPEFVSVDDLTNKRDRTLLWGYTPDRASHHVYLKDGEIHILVYNRFDGLEVLRHKSGHEIDVKDDGLIPSKRLYPEACDAEFCRILKERGFHLPFTTWDDQRQEKDFYGEVI